MEMPKPVGTEKRKCVDCGQLYEVKLYAPDVRNAPHQNIGCPICAGKKLRVEKEREKALVREQRALKKREWLNRCGIPAHFSGSSFDNFKKHCQPKTYEACLDYAMNFRVDRARDASSLVLLSPQTQGVGKTHLVCSIAKQVIHNWNGEDSKYYDCPVKFYAEPDLMMKIRATFNRDSSLTEEQVIRDLVRVPLLILDDVAKEQVADPRFIQRTWFSIINGRYNNDLPVIITSNCSKEDLRDYFVGDGGAEATYDRLLEMTNGKFYVLAGKSYRRHYQEVE